MAFALTAVTHEVLHYRHFWTFLAVLAALHLARDDDPELGAGSRSALELAPQRAPMAPSPTAASPRREGSTARRVAANSGWQMVSFAARAVSGLGTVVLIARSGGPQALGTFQFALVLTSFLPYYFGLPSLLTREVARAARRRAGHGSRAGR